MTVPRLLQILPLLCVCCVGCKLLPYGPSLEVSLESCAIVLPDNPSRIEAFAAGELNRHLQLASGRSLPVQRLSQPLNGRFGLFVGMPQLAQRPSLKPWEARYTVSPDGVRFYGEDHVVVRGATPQEEAVQLSENRPGTLFAVYEFLERECGFRWVVPGPSGVLYSPFKSLHLSTGDTEWRTELQRRVLRTPAEGATAAEGNEWTEAFSPGAEERAARRTALELWLRRNRMGGGPRPGADEEWFRGSVTPLPDAGLPLGVEPIAFDRMRRMVRSGIDGTDVELELSSWWTGGLLNYVLARAHVDPGIGYKSLEAEFCGLFGAAGEDIRAYHRFWQQHFREEVRPKLEEVSRSGFGNLRLGLYRRAGELFPPESHAEALSHLYAALEKPLSAREKTLVQSLFLGAVHQEVLAGALGALNAPPRKTEEMAAALERCRRLQRLRRQYRQLLARDLGRLVRSERALGDVTGSDLVPLFEGLEVLKPFPLIWYCRPDPTEDGEVERWQELGAAELRAGGWGTVRLDRPWNRQKSAAAGGGRGRYAGVVWAALVHDFPEQPAGGALYLVAQGVRDACSVYLNGQKLATHNPGKASDPRSFRVNLAEALAAEPGDEVLMVRLEQKGAGPAGIWHPLWLAAPKAGEEQDE